MPDHASTVCQRQILVTSPVIGAWAAMGPPQAVSRGSHISVFGRWQSWSIRWRQGFEGRSRRAYLVGHPRNPVPKLSFGWMTRSSRWVRWPTWDTSLSIMYRLTPGFAVSAVHCLARSKRARWNLDGDKNRVVGQRNPRGDIARCFVARPSSQNREIMAVVCDTQL